MTLTSTWQAFKSIFSADPAMDERWWPPLSGMRPSAAGVIITPDTSLQVSAVYRCVNLIANAFASLPGGVYAKEDERTRREIPNHDAERIFWRRPNPYQTPFVFKRMMMGHLVLRGNCYARIAQGPQGPELWPLSPDRVSGPDLLNDGRLRYEYRRPDGGTDRLMGDLEIMALTGLSSDGLRGLALSALAVDSIGLSMATEKHGAKLFSKGIRLAGALKVPGKLSKEAATALSDSFKREHSDYGLPVFEQGMEWQSMGMSNEDAQFLETRKFEVSDIARWFGVPPHMIGDVERSTSWGTGIENQTIQFVTDCLLPWVVLWEQAINETFISQRRMYVKFNINARLRADSKTRFDIYDIAIRNGIFSPNDCRALEDQNPRDGGDVYVDPSTRGSGVTPDAAKPTQSGPDMPPQDMNMPDNQPGNGGDVGGSMETGDTWAKTWARHLVEAERTDLAEGARKHAANPSAWRRFVASYYGRRVPVVSALCDPDAAKMYCAARREIILDAGIGILDQKEQAEAALVALAVREKAS